MSIDLSIIIVSWNTRDLLSRCLASIQNNSDISIHDDIETFVVDNGSSDGSVTMVRQKFQWIELIENDQNVFIDVNQAFLETFGVTREEAIGSNAIDLNMLYDPDDLTELRQTLKAQGVLKDFEIRVRKKSGDIGVIILSSDKFMMNGVEHTLTTGLDITERQKAEEKYRSIYNNSVEGIFQSSEDGL